VLVGACGSAAPSWTVEGWGSAIVSVCVWVWVDWDG
jgi:hypothetical protein